MGDLPRGITRRRDRYRVQVGYLGKTHHLGDFQSLQVAKKVLEMARGDIARGVFVPPSVRKKQKLAERVAEEERARSEQARSITVEEWANRWLASHKCTEGTRTSYMSLIRAHVLPAIGEMRVCDVTEEDTTRLLESLPTDPTRFNVGRCLRPMLKAASAEGLLDKVPHIETPKVKARTAVNPEGLATPQQVRALSEQMPSHLALAVMLAGLCALRAGEVLGLQRRDFTGLDEPDQAVLHVQRQLNSKTPGGASYTAPKAGSAGEVAIPSPLVPAIVEHLARYVSEEPEAPVFPSSRDKGRPVSPTALDATFRKARHSVPGCENLLFHDLRRTSLTLYAQAGATQAEIMARGRHKDPAVAARYQYATKARDRANADRMAQGW